MRSTAVASIALLLGSATAQSTTSLFLPGFDSQPLVASVKGSHQSTTTYFVQCAPNTDPTACGAGPGFTLIEGPSTAKLVLTEGDASAFSMEVDCLLAKSSAVCTETDNGTQANNPGTTSTVISGSDYSSAWLPVTITAGNEASSASTGASATAPTASATSTQTTLARTSTSASTGSQAAAASQASSTGAASSTSQGGVPQITGNAHWAIGGVAAAMALAAL